MRHDDYPSFSRGNDNDVLSLFSLHFAVYIDLYFVMASSNKTVIAFDLYGTLLSTESIAYGLATYFGDVKAQPITALWRRFATIHSSFLIDE